MDIAKTIVITIAIVIIVQDIKQKVSYHKQEHACVCVYICFNVYNNNNSPKCFNALKEIITTYLFITLHGISGSCKVNI